MKHSRTKFMTSNEAEIVRRAIDAQLREQRQGDRPTVVTGRERAITEAIGESVRDLLDEEREMRAAACSKLRDEMRELQLVVANLRIDVADFRARLASGNAAELPSWPEREFKFSREREKETPADPAPPSDLPPRREMN
jgi:hypothetical protein